ncbi:hypothetical protein FA13DRAFT_1179502 [Coprinellus micaceus]|uniref:Uncharacterized protein n=1 Tax=Coprinellus micaceus TaxID=71717 RepID=A0A4Y7SVR5_COPMI|nr:hypothetical protein FA13DRAFT_1179502 [Coprinellus micaceus]
MLRPTSITNDPWVCQRQEDVPCRADRCLVYLYAMVLCSHLSLLTSLPTRRTIDILYPILNTHSAANLHHVPRHSSDRSHSTTRTSP